MVSRNTELRNLPASSLFNVANILEINKDWQRVVPLIPKDIKSQHFERKYNWEEIQLIETHAAKTNRTYAEVLFDEWGTSGKVRPTLGFLMMILHQAQIFRAVDEIARMIGEPPPPRPLDGPGAPITTNVTEIMNNESVEQRLKFMDTISSSYLENSGQDHYLCNRTTTQVKEASVYIHNEKKSDSPEVSDMIKFPQSQIASGSDYLPNITGMLAEARTVTNGEYSSVPFESDSTDNTTSNIDTTSSQNDVSEFIPNFLPMLSASNSDIYDKIDKAILEDEKLIKFEYKDLERLTNNFPNTLTQRPDGPVGKIGSGGFGDVYVGTHKNFGPLAVKKVRFLQQMGLEIETVMKIFNTEVKSLSYLRHQNIVPIFGYCIDGPNPCLVCKYIEGGSLEKKIEAADLSEQQRIDILIGTAEGLKYIHKREQPKEVQMISNVKLLTPKKSYYLHGDVKSANILLTKDCIPKLCDFGLAKQLNITVEITKKTMGTCGYMAPEQIYGNITQKNDIFSFGIVMLELLTGLKAIVNANGESIILKDIIKENCPDGDITSLLDDAVPTWTKHQEIYELANKCIIEDKNDRPSIDYVCDTLSHINNIEV